VAPEAERRVRARSDRERIGFVLDSLSENLRVPLVLRDADGASYQEIADQLGIGLSAVKMRIKRAREEFRSLWREAFGEPESGEKAY
jgi:RNA polymerase sigma-70 factor (ECF subfamily)